MPGGVNWVSPDYLDFQALLSALTEKPWPVLFEATLYEEPVLMRRYMGWYLWPATLARPFGTVALSVLTPLWMAACLYLILYLACKGYRRVEQPWLAFVFLGSWGVYALETACLSWVDKQAPNALVTVDYSTATHWLSHGLGPHHWVPTVLMTIVCVREPERIRSQPWLAVVMVGVLFWSPLALAALVPLLLWLLWPVYNTPALRAPGLLLGLASGLVLLNYLASGTLEVHRGWLWTLLDAEGALWWWMPILVRTLPHVYLLWWDDGNRIPRPLRFLSVGLLLVLPLWVVGEANDWLQYAVLVPGAVLGMAWMDRVVRWGREGRPWHFLASLLLCVLHLVGSFIMFGFDNRTLPTYTAEARHTDVSVMWQAENIAPTPHSLALHSLRNPERILYADTTLSPPGAAAAGIRFWPGVGWILTGCREHPRSLLQVVSWKASGVERDRLYVDRHALYLQGLDVCVLSYVPHPGSEGRYRMDVVWHERQGPPLKAARVAFVSEALAWSMPPGHRYRMPF